MAHLKSIFKQSSFYLGSNTLVHICAMISLPVWTRVLSMEEYGIFSLAATTILLLSSSSKFGLQHAALRFYYTHNQNDDKDGYSVFYTTIVLSNLFIAAFIAFAFVLLFNKKSGFFGLFEQSGIILFIAALSIMNSIISIQMNLLRAAQKAKQYSLLTVIKRYSNFIFAIVVFALWGFNWLFLGWVLTDFTILFYLSLILRKYSKIDLNCFSLNFLRDMIKYGVPLLGFELTATLLAIGDRYLIKIFLGEVAVGMYSVGYNLASYASAFLTTPMRLAVIPKFLSLWERSGEKETREFLNQILKIYIILAIPLLFGMIYLKEDVTVVLASIKYRQSANIIPYVISSMVVYGGFFIYGAGFYIKKQTLSLAGLSFVAVLLNVAFNCYLIPRFGIIGAAFSTLLAYSILSFLIYFFSKKYIRVRIPFTLIIKCTLASLAMISVLSFIHADGLFILIGKVVFGAFIYGFLLIVVESEFRNIAIFYLRRVKLLTKFCT